MPRTFYPPAKSADSSLQERMPSVFQTMEMICSWQMAIFSPVSFIDSEKENTFFAKICLLEIAAMGLLYQMFQSCPSLKAFFKSPIEATS